MPTVRRSLWSLWLVWIVCLCLSIGGYAFAASGLADKGMERLAQAWDVVSQAIKVTLATTLAGEDVANDVLKVEQRFAYKNITLANPTTTVVKSGPGLLHLITVNKTAASGVITCYDNTAGSGTVIATITQPATLLASQISLPYDVAFSVGLTCVTATAAQDITVSYR